MKVETSFDHVWFAREHIDKIVKLTGAGIRCPDLSSLKELPKKYSVWIRGSMDAVYSASILLTVIFLFTLHFTFLTFYFVGHLAGTVDVPNNSRSNRPEVWKPCERNGCFAAVRGLWIKQRNS